MSMVLGLVLAGNRLMEINAGAVVHLFLSQVHIKMQRAPGWMPQSQG